MLTLTVATAAFGKKKAKSVELWPDGTEIPAWFSDTSRVDLSGLKRYVVTDYGVDRWADGCRRLSTVVLPRVAVSSSFREARS